MEFKEYLDELKTADLQTNETSSGKITIKQVQRNELRRKLMDSFYQYLADDDINVYQTADGIILNIDNDSIGDVNIEIKMTLKGLDYNLDDELEKYKLITEEKAAKKTAKKTK